MFDLGATDDRVVHDGGERSNVRLFDARLGADDGGTPNDRLLDHRPGFDHDLALDTALRVDVAVESLRRRFRG